MWWSGCERTPEDYRRSVPLFREGETDAACADAYLLVENVQL